MAGPRSHRTIVCVTDTSDRPTIEAAIAVLRAKKNRLPEAWVVEREEISDEIDELVAMWLEAPG